MNHLFHLVSQCLHCSRHFLVGDDMVYNDPLALGPLPWCILILILLFHTLLFSVFQTCPFQMSGCTVTSLLEPVLTSEEHWKNRFSLDSDDILICFHSLISNEQWVIFLFNSDNNLETFIFSHWLSKRYYWGDLIPKPHDEKLLKYN